jgi:hypothetical protein
MRGAVALLWLVAACHDSGDQPLDPVWGKQACDQCAMLVDDPRFAAQAATNDGEHVFFDDVGCLGAWLREHSAVRARAWVRRQERWVPAEEARFAGGARTPMGYGFIVAAEGMGWPDVRHALAARAAVEESTHAR